MEQVLVTAAAADVPVARHAIASHLRSLHVGEEMIDVAELLASELLTNAIRHAEPPFRCAAYVTSHSQNSGPTQSTVRLEVWDSSTLPPVLRTVQFDDEGGRGLHLVEKLSSRWGWQPTENGKYTWAEIDSDSQES